MPRAEGLAHYVWPVQLCLAGRDGCMTGRGARRSSHRRA